ncbi:putrescine importer [Paenibacillus tianmuensis]|uniref:Putrescine importer n=1 Tax=Paenibacillus tianmuensis TaxID=624147 RepID=A0A1G4QHP5_9BACL|nr:APC family permease [Paenibacillus tianmuensis]SCW44134.1 putrescine importer [Paenibacillus tianmuensis]
MERKPVLQRQLKLWHIVAMGVGYMAPMAVFDTFGIVSEVTSGHVPAAYLLTIAAVLFTAMSYGHMVKVYPSAGSAYTYTRQTIGAHAGFLVGWVSLLDYLFLPMMNALLTGIYLSSAFPGVPQWVWVAGFVALITTLCLFNVNVSVSVNALFVAFQFVVVVLFVVLAVYRLSAGGEAIVSAQPLLSADANWGALLTGASILCFSFLGFDAVTTLSEETVEPRKTIPRGILWITMLGGGLFFTASYFAQRLFPDVSVLSNPQGASAEIALALGGVLFQAVFLAAALTSTLASGLVSQLSGSRLLFAMGRDRTLPRPVFGYIHRSLGTPVFNILLIGLISLTALALDLLVATSFVNFGALTAFTFVNLSVIIHYIFREKQRSWQALLRYLLFPLAGIGFVLFFWTHLERNSLLLGGAWTLLGVLYLLWMTRGFRREPGTIRYEAAEGSG